MYYTSKIFRRVCNVESAKGIHMRGLLTMAELEAGRAVIYNYSFSTYPNLKNT